ncbi:MAG TPA: hypothetical protein VFB32_00305 [Rudaea sp.]|nr:hypothetical protein [Rudaea sp.]
MSDRIPRRELTLAEALRGLPQVQPGRDVWSVLAAELAPQARPRRRYALPAALAACFIAAAGVLWFAQHRSAPAVANASAATAEPQRASFVANAANAQSEANGKSAQNGDADTRLAALQARSQALEHWLRETGRVASPLPGQDLAAATELENLIGVVDVELAAAPGADAVPLWQRRVALLEDLTALRYSYYRLAEAGPAPADAGGLQRIN